MRCTENYFVLLAPTVIENWSIAEQDVEVAEKKDFLFCFHCSLLSHCAEGILK